MKIKITKKVMYRSLFVMSIIFFLVIQIYIYKFQKDIKLNTEVGIEIFNTKTLQSENIFDEEKEKIIYYKVVFTVYRHEKKFRLHVISAYPIDNWEKLKPVGFFKLAHNLVKGKKLPTPQK